MGPPKAHAHEADDGAARHAYRAAELGRLSSRIAPADLVGIYDGPGGCRLRVDTSGGVHGCGLGGVFRTPVSAATAPSRGSGAPVEETWRVAERGHLTVLDAEGLVLGRFRRRGLGQDR